MSEQSNEEIEGGRDPKRQGHVKKRPDEAVVDAAEIQAEASQYHSDKTCDLLEENDMLRKQVGSAKFFVLQCLKNASRNNVSEILSRIEDTQRALDPEVIAASVSGETMDAERVLETPPRAISEGALEADGALMLRVIQKIPSAAHIIDPSLAENKKYLTTILECNPEALRFFPTTVYTQWPEIVSAQAIKGYVRVGGCLSRLKRVLRPQFWGNRECVLGWVLGARSMHDSMSDSILSDPDILLAFATAVEDDEVNIDAGNREVRLPTHVAKSKAGQAVYYDAL